MSSLKAPLERRIQELKASIESKMTELAAYEQVLKLEGGVASGALQSHGEGHPPSHAQTSVVEPSFSGSRSEFVVSVLKAKASAGATPREIADMFASRKIKVGHNLVYNVVSQLHKQKKVTKREGRYFYAGKDSGPSASLAPSPAAAGPKKHRISEEGMKRIIAAAKKRWAKHRATQKR